MKAKIVDTVYVKQLQNGENEAFEYIFEWYKNSIYYFALSITHNRADAEEVVQETFIAVIKGITSLKQPEAFHSWLFSVAYNNTMKLFRKRQVIMNLDEDTNIEEMFSIENIQINQIEKQEAIYAIEDEFKKLSTKLHIVGQLYFFQEFTIPEISNILDIPEGTVKTRIKRLKDKVRPNLEERGYHPKKYFSFTAIPMLSSLYYSLLQQYPLSNASSNVIKETIVQQTLQTSIFAGVGVSLTKKVVEKQTKVVVSSLLSIGLATSTLMFYEFNKNDAPQIMEVSYNQILTNENLLVKIQFDKELENKDYTITYNDIEIDSEIKNDCVEFNANENGTYVIDNQGNRIPIVITNIDKQGPRVSALTYKNHQLHIESLDQDIDNTKSGVYYSNQFLPMDKNGNVEANLDGNITIVLYDLAGNYIEYDATIETI